MSTRRALLALVLGHWVLHGPVNARRLAGSIKAADDRAASVQCERRRAPRSWECHVLVDATSDSFPYFVLVERRSSCWRAWVDEASVGDDAAVLRGCVHLLEA